MADAVSSLPSGTPISTPRLGSARVMAFAVDYLFIATYGAALGAAAYLLRHTAFAAIVESAVDGPWSGHALSFLTLTLPVILYFAVCESSSGGATLGKRVFRLRVVGARERRRLSLLFALLRALVKFLPWEIAHAALWRIEGWPLAPQAPSAAVFAATVLSLLMALGWLTSVFVGDGRTPYDRLAGSTVLRRP